MRKTILFFLSSILTLILLACSSSLHDIDDAVGVYNFVYEQAPLKRIDSRDSMMILDGYGKGEYHKEGYVHEIKYTFEDPDIVITDKQTGIKYSGTLVEGELLLYDGIEGGRTTSEFLFKSKYAN